MKIQKAEVLRIGCKPESRVKQEYEKPRMQTLLITVNGSVGKGI